jgi:hypothetical protein
MISLSEIIIYYQLVITEREKNIELNQPGREKKNNSLQFLA